MNELICSLCFQEFDLEDRLPRFMPNCGHTFCSQCIEELLRDAHECQVECPEDKISLMLTKGEEVTSFPPNLAFKKILVARSARPESIPASNQPQRRSNQRMSDFSGIHFCTEHQKVGDLICLTDRSIICVDCGLFGDHRNHSFKRFDLFKEETKSKLEKLHEKQGGDMMRDKFEDCERRLVESRGRILLKQERALKSVEKSFEAIFAKLRSKEAGFKETIKQAFLKFDIVQNTLSSSVARTKEKNSFLTSAITKLNTQISTKYVDLLAVYDQMWGEKDLGLLLEEINKELDDFDTKMRHSIDLELDKITFGINQEQIINLIETNLKPELSLETINEESNEKAFGKTSNKELTLSHRISESGYDRSERTKELSTSFEPRNSIVRSYTGFSRNFDRDDKQEPTREDIDKMVSPGIRNFRPFEQKKKTLPDDLDRSILDESDESDRTPSRRDRLETPKSKGFDIAYKKPVHNRLGGKLGSKDDQFGSPRVHSTNFNSVNQPLTGSIIMSHRILHDHKEVEERSRSPLNRSKILPANSKSSNSVTRRPSDSRRPSDDQEINLANQDINDSKLYTLITDIQKNRRAKLLNLDGNKISEIGFGMLLSKLASHPCIEVISLSGNLINESVFGKIEEHAQKLKKINHFVFLNSKYFKNKVTVKRAVDSLVKYNIRVDV